MQDKISGLSKRKKGGEGKAGEKGGMFEKMA